MTVNSIVVGEVVGDEGVERFENAWLSHCECLEEVCEGGC